MASSKDKVVRIEGYTQERGDLRRQKLIDAASELFTDNDIDQVSFVDLAQHAGIPTTSAYHFYKNKNDLLAALLALYHEEVNKFVLRDYDDDTIHNWSDILDQIIDRAVEYFQNHEVARKLFYSGKTPPEIKLLDRSGDKTIGGNIELVLKRYFELPAIPDDNRVFHILVELIDTIFTLSVIEHGKITPAYVDETKRATKSYLRTYLPDFLIRK